MESTRPQAVLSKEYYLRVMGHVTFPESVEFVALRGTRLVLRMKATLPTVERGHMLLDLEKRLHREVDPAMEVLLEPTGDRNRLRAKLRGVVMK